MIWEKEIINGEILYIAVLADIEVSVVALYDNTFILEWCYGSTERDKPFNTLEDAKLHTEDTIYSWIYNSNISQELYKSLSNEFVNIYYGGERILCLEKLRDEKYLVRHSMIDESLELESFCLDYITAETTRSFNNWLSLVKNLVKNLT